MPVLLKDDFINSTVNTVCVAMCSIKGVLFVCDKAYYSVTYLPGDVIKHLIQGLKVTTWFGRKENISMAWIIHNITTVGNFAETTGLLLDNIVFHCSLVEVQETVTNHHGS